MAREPVADGSRRYAAFISYSRGADGRLAPALQSGLQRFAKPWYRVRALRVFRDDANLSANPALWGSITAALDESEYLILLASPDAAGSEWVAKEVEYWLAHRCVHCVLIALTDGDLFWAGGEVDWTRTTSMPRALGAAFTEEPRYVDARWARTERQLARRDPRLRDAIADLAAPLHGRSKDELLSEDLRQHRRALRLVWGAAILLAVLAAAATYEAVDARQARDDARAQRDTAQRERRSAQAAQSRALAGQAVASLDTDPGLGLQLAVQATEATEGSPTPEAVAALRAAVSADLLRATRERRDQDGINSAEVDAASKRVVTTGDDGWVVVSAVPGGRRPIRRMFVPGINDAAFQPRGPLVAIAPDDGRVRLWNPADGSVERLREQLEKKKHAVASVAFNRGGTLLVSTSNDGRARLWSIAGRTLLRRLGHFGKPVTHATFSPAGDRVLTAGDDGVARIWRVRDGKLLQTLDHKAEIHDAEFSPNGRLVVTAGVDGTAKIWGTDERRPLQTLTHSGAVETAVFDTDGEVVLTASADGTARLWKIDSGREVATLGKHTGPLAAAAFSRDGRLVITASADGTARIWDRTNGRSDYTLAGHSGTVAVAVFSPNGKYVITASQDGSTRIWDAPADTVLHTFDGGGIWIDDHGKRTSAAFSPNGRLLVVAGNMDGTARMWRVGGRVPLVLDNNKSPVTSAAFNRQGTRLVTASEDGKARIWRVSDGTAAWVLGDEELDEIADSAAFDPNGTRVVTTSRDKKVRIWRVGSTAPPLAIKFKGGLLNNGVFDPDGERVVIASDDGITTILDASSGKALHTLHGVGAISDAEFSPDGTRVVTANGDWTARIWNVDREQIETTLRGHEGPVRSAVFSRDGRFVLTASDDGTARVWDVASGYAIATFHGHTGPVAVAAFSPGDETLVVTGDADGKARIWRCVLCRMSPAGLLERAGARLDASR